MMKMMFPFSILPDIVIGNTMYSDEAYKSVCEQLAKGVPVRFHCKSFDQRNVGVTTGFKDNRVFVEADDEDFIDLVLKIGEDRLCVSTWVEAEAETREDGVQVAISANVNHLIVLAKSAIPELVAFSKADAIFKEKTLGE